MNPARERYLRELAKRTGMQLPYVRSFMSDMEGFVTVVARHFNAPPLSIATNIVRKSLERTKQERAEALGLTQQDVQDIAACVTPDIHAPGLPMEPAHRAVNEDDLSAIFG